MRYGFKPFLFVLALALCPTGMTRAQGETPRQWYETPGRNNVVPAEDLPDHIGEDNRLWHVELHGRRFFNIITVDGDRVYCGMTAQNLPERIKERRAGGLLCLDLRTGETVWQRKIGNGAYGVDPVPIIEGDRIYQQVGTNAYCLDKSTGDTLWETSIDQRYKRGLHGTHSTGLLIGDYWYLATGHASGTDDPDNWVSNSLEHPFHPNIVVLQKETGKLVAQDAVPINAHQHGSWCALSTGVVDGRRLVFWGDAHGYVHAYEAPDKFEGEDVATLRQVWYCDANPHSYRYMEDGGRMPYKIYNSGFGPCEIIATPVFHEGLLYVAIGRDKEYSPKEGARHIGDGALVCIDPRGEGNITETNKLWTNTELGRTFCAPSVTNGMVIAADHSGYVLGVDKDTGETLWKEDIVACKWNYFHAVGDEKVYTMNERRDFFILEADRDGGRLFHAQVDGANNPQVGMTDGILIVGTMRSIDAYGGPKYLEKHGPAETVASSQIRKGAALDEPLEKDAH